MDYFNLTRQGQESLAIADKIAKKKKQSAIATENLVEAFVKTSDTSVGQILLDRRVTRADVKQEIVYAKEVDAHDQKDVSLNYMGMRNPERFENRIKSSPVPFIKETGVNPIRVLDRQYYVTDYVLYGLKYGKAMLEQRGKETVDTQDVLVGLVDLQDTNAFWLLLKLIILRAPNFLGKAYTNLVQSHLELRWYKDGEETTKKLHAKQQRNQLSNKLAQADYSILDEYGKNLTKLAAEHQLSDVTGREKEIADLALTLNRSNKSNALLIGPAGVGKTAIVEGLAVKIAKGEILSLKGKTLISLDPAAFGKLLAEGVSASIISHLINELTAHKERIVYFDEIQFIRKSFWGTGILDMLKPALARGDIHVIGSTTPLEAEQFFNGDEALKRRFEIIDVKAPNRQQTDKIVAHASLPYENFYHVHYSINAKKLAVDLAMAYLNSPLPDSALTILDNAGALVNLRDGKGRTPAEAYVIHSHTVRDSLAIEKKRTLNDEKIGELKQQLKHLRTHYEEEKHDAAKHQYLRYVRVHDVVLATEKILGRALTKAEILRSRKARKVSNDSVLSLASRMKQKVIGQNEAINVIAQSLIIAQAGISQPGAPIGSFFFAGLTGTGKTETAKQLAIEEYGSEQRLVRFNMPEYVGLGGAQRFAFELYSKVISQPNCVILLDEIEKADPTLHNLLLGVMDDGSLLPDVSVKADFSHSIIVMTSNVGARYALAENQSIGFDKTAHPGNDDYKKKILRAMKAVFSPEFINRLTKVVVFNALDDQSLARITNKVLRQKRLLLREKKIELSWDQSVLHQFVTLFKNAKNGARPLERAINELVMSKIAKMMLQGKLKKAKSIDLTWQKNDLQIKVE